MHLNRIILLAFLFSVSVGFSQEEKETVNLDSIQDLTPVILTGQYKPQAVDKSIFEVDVLRQTDIKRMAGNSLDDVLKQSLNLNVIPNSGEGRSGVEQFGFNSEYIKILIDGIPVIGDEGFGNAIDISQINLDDVEQIEIVEGSLGVQYGANAVTGVINIITKKGASHKWNVTPYVQEETVGSEYNWNNEGRHIRSIKIGHNFSDSWYGEASFIQNDFQGFFGEKNGEFYYNPEDSADKTRGYDWLPKLQHTAKALVNYNKGNFRAFYKFEYFDEQTDKFANTVFLNYNSATQTINPTANDEIFRSDRIYHHLNFTGKLNEMNYNLSVSYQNQKRNRESFTRNLLTGDQFNSERFDYNTRKGFFSRGTLNNLVLSDLYNLEIGYEITSDKGSASGLSEQNSTTDRRIREVNLFSGFASAEFQPTQKLSFRPGIRYMYSNKFSNQFAFSFSGKYDFDNGYQLRAVLGSSPKLPNYEELYFYLVDSNHDVRGNPDLKTEKGKSAFVHLKKRFSFNESTVSYQPKFSAWYLDVDDKIDLIVARVSPLSFQFENIDTYKTWGLAFRNKLYYNQFSMGFGVSLNGESKILKSMEEYDDRFLYSVEVSGQLSYLIEKWNTSFSGFYKYNGRQQQFVSTIDSDGNSIISKDTRDAFSWLDFSIRKTFASNQFELTLGARNLLDIKEIKTVSPSGVDITGNNSLLIGYGRSYFLKALFNFNF